MIKLCSVTSLLFLVAITACTENDGDIPTDSNIQSGSTSSCTTSTLDIQLESTTSAGCDRLGSITVSADGGEGGYNYSIGNENASSLGVFDDLMAGVYTVSVIDAAGCSKSQSVTVEASDDAIALSLTINQNAGCGIADGSISASAEGGEGELLYSIDGGEFDLLSTFSDLDVGAHSVVVKDDNGCQSAETVEIKSGVSYQNEVASIISQNCATSGCHNGSRSPNLSMLTSIQINASRVNIRTLGRSMPPRSRTPLTDEQIQLINCWVNDGALDN